MSKLFERNSIGGMKLKNRIFASAIGTSGNSTGGYTKADIDYFVERAKGGTGLIITGANVVTSKFEERIGSELSSRFHIKPLSQLVNSVHHYGAKLCVQIYPGNGRLSYDFSMPPRSVSECSSVQGDNVKCIPFTKEEIKYLISKMATAASYAAAANADAIELSAYGGYLMDQFHSRQWNKRTDEYGGSLENRLRFTTECVQEIKKVIPADMPVIIKFTADDCINGQRTIEEGIEMAKIFEKAGVDALQVCTGIKDNMYESIPTVYSKGGNKLSAQKAIKEAVNIPVLGDGKLDDPSDALKALENDCLDYVGLGHQLIADPSWTNKVMNGQEEDIVPCIGCNECLLSEIKGRGLVCAVNPLCQAEKKYQLPEGKLDRRVLIIGGGPGGLQAAITAQQRGFDVELWEKTDRLGGTLWAAGGPCDKKSLIKLVDYLVKQCQKSDIVIKLNQEATEETLSGLTFDKVIWAAGANISKPPIKGINKTLSVIDFLNDTNLQAEKVVVIGGGLAGTEAAVELAQQGKDVTIVEMLSGLLAAADHCVNNDIQLKEMVKNSGVKIVANAKVTEIKNDSISYEQDGQSQSLVCDTVINATGFRANNQLEDFLYQNFQDIAIIGDALKARKILDAIHEGYHAIRVMS